MSFIKFKYSNAIIIHKSLRRKNLFIVNGLPLRMGFKII